MSFEIGGIVGGRAAWRAAAAALLVWAAGLASPQRLPSQRPPRAAVAIVVHPRTAVENLSLEQLRRVFLAEQQFWSDNSRITLLVRAPVAYEREVVLDRIYRMTEDRFRQYWIAKMFRAEVPSGPKIVYSSEMTRELVTAIPGAIAFMPASAATAGVKVLRIDGKLPGDAGYPLR